MPALMARVGYMGRMTIEDLALIVAQGFSELSGRIEVLDRRITVEVTSLRGEIRELNDRVTRLEYAAYQIQKDIITLDEEMRGIHKVIDYLNRRVITLEYRAGMQPLL